MIASCGTSYPTNGITVPTSGWFTVVLKWDGNQFSVTANGTTESQTSSVLLAGAETIVGSNVDGFNPVNHLNGQLEMLAYYDDLLDSTRTSKLFQTNHIASVKTHVDILGRSKKDVIDTGLVKLENEYTYKSPVAGRTSLQVESITKYDESVVSYEYDVLGNVIHMLTPDGTYKYEYDYLNRLIREFNPVSGLTMIMAYTGNNNILSKKYYNGDHPLDVSITPYESYEYHYDLVWKDKLTEVVKKIGDTQVDSTELLYNSNFMGNPSEIGDKELTWKGRQLTNINGSSIEYTYNQNGVRLVKIVNGLKTSYYLNKKLIIAEAFEVLNEQDQKEEKTINYFYSEKNDVSGFEYDNKMYYYIKNFLGIITEVVDENGQVMVSYKYDSWGKIIHKVVNNQTIDDINHFVYKGYYLDNETGWYYLISRYYNPNLSRFINCDIKIGQASQGASLNLFTYCDNNPIMKYDFNGELGILATILVGAVIGAVVGSVMAAVKASADGKTGKEFWGDVLVGALIGGATRAAFALGGVAGAVVKGTIKIASLTTYQAVGLTLGIATGVNAIAGMGAYAIEAWAYNKDFNPVLMASNGVKQAAKGLFNYTLGGFISALGFWDIGVNSGNFGGNIIDKVINFAIGLKMPIIRSVVRFSIVFIPAYILEELFNFEGE